MRQPQAIIGEGIISNNNQRHEQIIGEGLASGMSDCDDLARADFMGTVKSMHFSEEDDFKMASSLPIPAPDSQVSVYPAPIVITQALSENDGEGEQNQE